MRIQYHKPLGIVKPKYDPLPTNWEEIADTSNNLPNNLGVVEEGLLYRSGIVWSHQVKSLNDTYGIKHIFTLVHGDWLEDYYEDDVITIHQFPFLQRGKLTFEKARDIVEVMNRINEPKLVCCLKGAVRTGQVVAAYEILNGRKTNMEAVFENFKYGNYNLSSTREIMKYGK